MQHGLKELRLPAFDRLDHHPTEDAFMVPGMGAQPVPVKEWVPANDNVAGGKTYPVGHKDAPAGWMGRGMMQEKAAPAELDVRQTGARGSAPDWAGIAQTAVERFPVVHEVLGKAERGQYVGLTRASNQPPVGFQSDARIGPYIATATGGKFYPLDPRPSEVDIRHIARSQSMTCRYNGSVRRFYSTAEHATLIARSLVKEHGKRVALAGLLHDSPETYTGFGDVVSPMKSEFPFIGEMEDNIYRKAIAPHFGLSPAIPHVVHAADMRIRGNEVSNLVPMAWHEEYDNPLPVPLMYWSPAEAEREFLATYTALTGEVG